MKEKLQTLLQSLRDEQTRLEVEKRDLGYQLSVATMTRRSSAQHCINDILLPNLEMSTIQSLQYEVPEFQIPLVSKWFGFSKQVDPKASINTLRMQLGAYIDNSSKVLPKIWRENITPIDQSIRNLQENLIKSNAERISEVNDRIAALEKLLNIDPRKMDPKVRQRVEQAVASQSRRSSPYRIPRKAMGMAPAYPSQSQINSDSGPSLLEMWLWYELLSSHSEVSNEVVRIESGGEFGGAGASGDFSDTSSVQVPVSNESLGSFDVSDVVPLAVAVEANNAGNDNIETHYDLGAGNFS